jgi:hypothetical protein
VMFMRIGQFIAVVIGIVLSFLTCTTDHALGPDASAPCITAMADTSVSVHDSLLVYAAVTAGDSNGLRFIWDIRELKIHDTIRDASRKIAFRQAGRFSVIVSAINGMDLTSGADTIVISVFAKLPVITKISADSVYSAHDTARITVQARDSDGVVKKYLWSFDGHSYDTTKDSTFITVWPYVPSGLKTLYVKVIDDDSLMSQTDSRRIRVLPGAPTIKAMNDTSIWINDSLIMRAFAADRNGTIKQYLWSFDNVHWEKTVDPMRKAAWSVRESGAKTLYVQAIDDDSLLSNIDSARITVRLGAPVISAMAETTVTAGDTFLLHANASDSNGTIKKYFWTTDGKNYDSTSFGFCKAYIPISSFGQKSEWESALESQGIVPKNNSGFYNVAAVYAVDNDGIFSRTAYIVVNVHH